jgi:hypothetical protein
MLVHAIAKSGSPEAAKGGPSSDHTKLHVVLPYVLKEYTEFRGRGDAKFPICVQEGPPRYPQ